MRKPSIKRRHFLARKGVREIPFFVYKLAVWMMKLLSLTWRVRIDDPHRITDNIRTEPAIYAVWHNRLMFLPTVSPKKMLRNIAGLASNSRDGEYAAQLMRAFGLSIVRGSTSRGGHRALVQLRRTLNQGTSIALTPDGPRGPRYEVQQGVVILAQLTGYPIIPASLNSSRHWELKGWDKTQIPKPFAKVSLVVGAPIQVPREMTDAGRQAVRRQVNDAMLRITADSNLQNNLKVSRS